jgi:two-component system CheB/CheR fusion protein
MYLVSQLGPGGGAAPHAADTGPAGLSLMDEVRPDVGIIDLGLPGLDGFELARRIRANPRHDQVYLIALTGYGQASDRVRALQAGFDEHVVKPMGPETLVELLSSGPESQHESSLNRAFTAGSEPS